MNRPPWVSPILSLVVVLLLSGADAAAGTYTTTFPATEDPMSESGKWANGATNGLDWHDVQTSGGKAYGTLATASYSDPTAILTGVWGPDQTATATVYSQNQTDSYYQEVELRLRSTMTAHSSRGYEVFFRVSKTSAAYCSIVRWNGAAGNFTELVHNTGATYGVQDGDVVKATIVGTSIKGYINGAEKCAATDSTYGNGNPGIGFNYGVGNTYADFGFYDFTATDGLGAMPPPPPMNLRVR